MDETDTPIQKAVDAIMNVTNVHENHLYPEDSEVLNLALACLLKLKAEGFK